METKRETGSHTGSKINTENKKKTHVESKTGPKKTQTRILRLNKATQRGMRT